MSGDSQAQAAKALPHHVGRNQSKFEHQDITDNRQVWEILEEEDKK